LNYSKKASRKKGPVQPDCRFEKEREKRKKFQEWGSFLERDREGGTPTKCGEFQEQGGGVSKGQGGRIVKRDPRSARDLIAQKTCRKRSKGFLNSIFEEWDW